MTTKERPHETGRPLIAHVPRQCCDLGEVNWVSPSIAQMILDVLLEICESVGAI